MGSLNFPRLMGVEAVPVSPTSQLPTWREMLSDGACHGASDKLKVVAKFSTNRVHPLVLCHQNNEDLSGQYKTTVVQSSKCLIAKLFQSAVTTFLRSRLEHCKDLKVSIYGNNYELCHGRVRNLEISASEAVYKGINLTCIQLAAADIKLKRSASRLLPEPFQVRASIRINKQDLLSSLASPLLAKTLEEVSLEGIHITRHVSDIKMSSKEGTLQLQPKSLPKNSKFACTSLNGLEEDQRTVLRLQVEDEGRTLCVLCSNAGTTGAGEHAFLRKFWLGPNVNIKNLDVQASEILLDGQFLVQP